MAEDLQAAMFASRSRDTVEVCELGNLRLESGDVIPNFRMSYVTFGTLNSDKSNAILSLHGLRAHRESQSFWAGPGKALDADRYYIIQPDTLGAACYDPNATTSPTRSGLKMKFPRFTIRDMVMAEHRMLTECLGINHIVAVTGVSLGGAESLQWAVSFPEFMDAVIPIVPPARTNLHLTYILEAARRAIMLDPKWQAGDYPDDDPPVDGTALAWLIQNSFGTDPQWYEERFATKSEVVAASASDYFEGRANIEPRDWFIACGPPRVTTLATRQDSAVIWPRRHVPSRLEC